MAYGYGSNPWDKPDWEEEEQFWDRVDEAFDCKRDEECITSLREREREEN